MYTSITNRGVSIKNKMIENYYILNQIVQSIDTGIVIIFEKSLLHINNEMRRITERTYKNLEQDLLGIIMPDNRRQVIKKYVSVLKEFTDKEEIYFDIILPNNSLKSVRCRLTRIKIFDKNGIFATVHDEFSEVRRDFDKPLTLRIWRQHRADYEHVLNKSYDFLTYLDTDFKVNNMSKNVEKFLGYNRKDFIGRRLSSVCVVNQLNDLVEVLCSFSLSSCQTTNRVVKNLHLTLISKSNIPEQFSVSVFPIKVGNYIKGYCLFFTSFKNIDKSVLSIEEIAAHIAHEFRSPLNAIVGFANIISDENLNSYERNLYLNYVKQSCKSLLSIVDDYSDFNKLSRNKIVIHNDKFNLNLLFDQLEAYCTMFKKDFNKYDIQLIPSLQFPDNEVFVIGDQQRIFQIMINLLSNAFKNTEKGFIKYQYIIENNYLFLKVSDSGIGISKENLNKIFNRHLQLNVTNCNNGSGLGLAISKSLVELMGGTITVNSELGIGTEFLIKLPMGQSVNQTTTNQSEEESVFDFSDKTVLVAEDAQINFVLMQKLLEPTKVKILWAQNGQQCVDMFKQNPDISLILMDMLMPIMDGFEAAKRILEIDPTIPIIAQTAFSFAEEKKRILSIGCVDFIAKPIEKSSLYRKMSKAFR